MALKQPESTEECVYFTRREVDSGKVMCWVFKEKCPECKKELMGKPVDSGDRKEKTLELDIDEDADEGKIQITITVEGIDESNNKHEVTFEFELDIERQKHNLEIERIIVRPDPVDRCTDTRVDVKVFFENKGLRNEDEVAVEVSVPALRFIKKITELEVDDGDSDTITFSIPISKSTPFGSFVVTAKTFFNDIVESNRKTAEIIVLKCEDPVIPTSTTTVTAPVVAPPPTIPQDQIIILTPQPKEENTLVDGAFFTAALIMANLIALTILGVMGYGWFKKPPIPKVPEHIAEGEVDVGKEYY